MDPAKRAAFNKYLEKRTEEQRQVFDRVIDAAGFQDWELRKIAEAECEIQHKEDSVEAED